MDTNFEEITRQLASGALKMVYARRDKTGNVYCTLSAPEMVARDTDEFLKVVDDLIAANADKVAQVQQKPANLGWFVGQAMQRLGAEADPAFIAILFQARFWTAKPAT